MSKLIPLTQGYSAIVDDEDYDWLMRWKWHATKSAGGSFYARRNSLSAEVFNRRVVITMHRTILGVIDNPSVLVDHINRDGLDNRRTNLRLCNKSQNGCNSLPRRGSSKYKGVSRKGGMWVAQISDGSRRRSLGYFQNELDAAAIYDEMAIRIHGAFALTNQSLFPEDFTTSTLRGDK